jgi:hypothetical protein
MKTITRVTVGTIVMVLFAVNVYSDFSYPKLPWYERYFFPVGVKFSYEMPLIPDDGDWYAWSTGYML